MWKRLVLLATMVVGVFCQAQPPAPPPSENVTYTFNNQYAAFMPKILRPGQNFDVSVIHIDPPRDGSTVPVTIALRSSDDESRLLVEKMDNLPTANCDASVDTCPVTKVLSFQVPMTLEDNEYNVTVMGQSGSTQFFNSTLIKVKRKTFSIFVQTDRAMYKANQLVRFRVVCVDADLKPVNTKVNISMHDINDNRLKQWMKVECGDGIIGREFKLSDQPPLGDWSIKVVGENVGVTKQFEVAEYVLPKYEVTLDLPNFMLSTYKKIMATVTAKYTYGQPVKGRCHLFIQMKVYTYERTVAKSLNISQELKDGKADFEVKMTQLDTIVPPPYSRYDQRSTRQRMEYRSFDFSASCREELTGKVLVKNGSVRVENQKFKLQFLDVTPENFKPGLVYKAFVQLKLVDDSPPSLKDLTFPGNGSRIQLKLYNSDTYYRNTDERVPMDMVDINDAGIAVFKIQIPKDISNLNIRVDFNDGIHHTSVSKYVQKFKTRDSGALQITLANTDGTLKAGQKAQFNISTGTVSTKINLQFLAKGELVQSLAITVPEGKTHTFSMDMTDSLAQQLAPKGRVIAWYMSDTLEIISDSADFGVEGVFANKVSLKYNMNETKPGTDVRLTVKATAGSDIYVLAVDQSALLLASGNDLSQEEVISELETYDSTNDQDDSYGPRPMFARGKRSSWCPWCYFSTGGKDSSEIFSNAGVKMMTDIYMYVEPQRPRYYFRGQRGEAGGVAEAGPAPPQRELGAQGSRGSSGSSGSSGGSSRGLKQVSRVRSRFPETWLWQESSTGADGEVVIKTTVPDTITSWVTSAFAMHNSAGLGISDETAEITVFKPFFISLNLPYSVIRGEEVELQMTVFNYLASELSVLVKLKKSMEFSVKETNGIEFIHANVETTVRVGANDGKTISVWIKPNLLGNMAIEAQAQSIVAADAVRRMLLVEAEGAALDYDINFLLESQDDSETVEKSSIITLPKEGDGLVPGSVKLEATAIGDIMGQSMNNLDNLVKMPYGCGEQNMLNFAPNIFVRNYMKATGKHDSELEAKSETYMEAGYQRELTYQRTDGSFSAFGNSDESGSTWLTAFVVKSFYQAREYTDIDLDNVASATRWMIEQQLENGQFNEPGRVIHTDMQGGAASGVTLTAYVAITLLEMRDMKEFDQDRMKSSLEAAMLYLKNELESNNAVKDDPYIMAIIAYTMALAQDDDMDSMYETLKSMAINEDGMTHWDKKKPVDYVPEKEDDVLIWRPPRVQAQTSTIESTSYAMLTYVAMGKVADAVPIMRWLVSQRNSLGGYTSTQDTIMALHALAEFGGSTMGNGGTDLAISVETSAGIVNFPQITSSNALVLQKERLGMSGTDDLVTVKARGRGLALVQIAVSYNLMHTNEKPDIDLELHSEVNEDGTVSIEICATYVPKGDSGMAVFEASMLSGYVPTNIEELKKSVRGLRRVDENDKTFFFYMDQLLSGQLTCLTVNAAQVNKVVNIQKAKVKVYPYYAPYQTKTTFYLPRALTDNSICDACPECCDDDDDEMEFKFTDKEVAKQREQETIYRGHPTVAPWIGAASMNMPMVTIIMTTILMLLGHRYLF